MTDPTSGLWLASPKGAEVRFLGRGQPQETVEYLHQQEASPPTLSWAKQTHSREVLSAKPGRSGEGDALWTCEPGLALCVVTADCVPVLLVGTQSVSAIHAGWRGIVNGVIAATIEALPDAPRDLTAWIGPAIGPCCYEVDDDVAQKVVAASDASICRRPGVGAGISAKPHLDLQRAAEIQLSTLGVMKVHRVEACTRCRANDLHSYRREGPGAGRNRAIVWRSP